MTNLDPQAKVYLDMFNQGPALQSMDAQTVREMFAQLPLVEVELAPLAKVENRLIPVGPDDEINVRIYTPEGQGPFPLFVYFHGGGWVIGDLETADASCRMIANRTESIVVSVDYRLAPEYKFPIPVQDSYAALQWVKENAASINGNASILWLVGIVQGGILLLSFHYYLGTKMDLILQAQILIYPVTNLDYTTNSYEEFKEGFGLDRELMIWFGNYYITSEVDTRNPLVAPLLAENLSNLPPALVITAENDVLKDEGQAYAKRLQEAGVKVDSICEQGLVHGYFTNMAVFPERIKGTISKITQFINEINPRIKNAK